MKRFVEGEDRRQATLLPDTLEDFVAEDNPVRVIEVFIDELDLGALGFAGVVPEATGRPAYHPATLLKIYLYGYLNRIQSSRRLERETQRNIELMWLTGRLMPDFKTIADFRRDNGPAKRDFTPTEIAERKKLRAKLTECREGVAVLAIVTADRLDSSEEVKDLLREMRAVNTGLQKDLAELKKIEKYATIAAQAAEFLNKSVDRLIKLAAAIS